jgi:hypothetical protein
MVRGRGHRMNKSLGPKREHIPEGHTTTVFLDAGDEPTTLSTNSKRESRIMMSRWPPDNGS